jgi:hypothetical protein
LAQRVQVQREIGVQFGGDGGKNAFPLNAHAAAPDTWPPAAVQADIGYWILDPKIKGQKNEATGLEPPRPGTGGTNWIMDPIYSY